MIKAKKKMIKDLNRRSSKDLNKIQVEDLGKMSKRSFEEKILIENPKKISEDLPKTEILCRSHQNKSGLNQYFYISS